MVDFPTRTKRQRKAFTLIELLVVISIIGVLISLLLPTLKNARESVRATVCLSNERQLSLAIHLYAQDYDDLIPPFSEYPPGNSEYYIATQFAVTLFPYYQNVDLWLDPSRELLSEASNPVSYTLPEAMALADKWVLGHVWGWANYSTYGGQYMFVDHTRMPHKWQRISNIYQPVKTATLYCSYYGPGVFAGTWAQILEGRHNGTENFLFMDGHAGVVDSQPLIDFWQANGGATGSHGAYSYTYPPGVNPGQAQWWTVPWYPDLFPYSYLSGPLPP